MHLSEVFFLRKEGRERKEGKEERESCTVVFCQLLNCGKILIQYFKEKWKSPTWGQMLWGQFPLYRSKFGFWLIQGPPWSPSGQETWLNLIMVSHKLRRFWWAGVKIYLSFGHPRQALYVSSLVIKTAIYQSGVICLFPQSFLTYPPCRGVSFRIHLGNP